MKKNSPLFLYLLVTLVILGGLGLLIFKDAIIDVLRQRAGIDTTAQVSGISAAVPTVSTSSALDVGVLKMPRFTSLVNQVNNFNFDNICWRPNAVASKAAVAKDVVSEEEASEETVVEESAPNCVQGNSAPFLVKDKK